ncbi:MAG: hypothetical protein IH944_10390 [Armatimonadetes bacterium]|nr:hypothetical protein [Armatimonadota bacterium]
MNRGVAVLLILFSCGLASAQVPEPATFDGATWAGVTLGVTRDADVKRMLPAGKGAIWPEALKIRTDDPDLLIDVLLDGRGADAIAQAVLFRYEIAGPKIETLEEQFGERPVLWYHNVRREAWHLAVFAKRGVVLVMKGEDDNPRTRAVVLCLRERLPLMLAGFSTKPTKIIEDDPGKNWNRVISVGRFTWSFNPSRAFDWESVRPDIEREIAFKSTGPRVVFIRSGPNVYEVSGSSTEGDSGLLVEVAVKLEAQTPYGLVSATATATEMTKRLTAPVLIGLVGAAVSAVNSNMARQVNALRFGEPEVHTRAAMERLLLMSSLPDGPS